MKNNTNARGGLGCLLAAAVYSAAVFFLKGSLNAAQWIFYIFTLAAFLLLAIRTFAKGSKKNAAMDAVSGMVAKFYFALQFVLGGVIGMCFDKLSASVALIGCAVLLAAYLIFAIGAGSARNGQSAQERNNREGVSKLRFWENDLLGMAEQHGNPEIKKLLMELAEEAHYSDPANLPGLADLEEGISRNIALLRMEMSNDLADIRPGIETLRRQLKERNRMADIMKK